jgi:hypothetical protein
MRECKSVTLTTSGVIIVTRITKTRLIANNCQVQTTEKGLLPKLYPEKKTFELPF